MSRRTDVTQDGPLRRWGEALRRDRRARRRRATRMVLTGSGCAALLATALAPPTSRLLWNASASAPIGLYAVSPEASPDVGDIVVAWPPATVRTLAATRHYLPLGVPLVKRVAAGPGQRICALGPMITIDGKVVAVRRESDAWDRPMPWWSGCRWLRNHQFLLLMTDVQQSFDGRYFGITNGTEIIARARLIWRR